MVHNPFILECTKYLASRTKEDAIRAIRCLQENGMTIYWMDAWGGRIVIRSKEGKLGGWKSVGEELMGILNVKSRDDWERIKKEYNL